MNTPWHPYDININRLTNLCIVKGEIAAAYVLNGLSGHFQKFPNSEIKYSPFSSLYLLTLLVIKKNCNINKLAGVFDINEINIHLIIL